MTAATPFDGGPRALACLEHPRCASGRRVMLCHFDGEHGNWMEGDVIEGAPRLCAHQ